MNSRAENVIRKIIREELEYYFEKLEKKLVESVATPKVKQTRVESTTSRTPEIQQNLKRKYSSLLESVSEGMDTSDFFGDTRASLGITADDIPDSPHMAPIKDALSRDYSALLKKISQGK